MCEDGAKLDHDNYPRHLTYNDSHSLHRMLQRSYDGERRDTLADLLLASCSARLALGRSPTADSRLLGSDPALLSPKWMNWAAYAATRKKK